ncbi:MAG: CPBP family glutamic-type intramembrane protease [Planctomycetota bacterium]|nr:CPBP family glutamic-type intramembrane protease [Planctomycetota bacterium]
MRGASITRTVFRVEVVQLLRDRRAFFAAVLLPVFLYPLMLSGSDLLKNAAVGSLEERELTVLVDSGDAPPELATRLLDAVGGPATLIVNGDASSLTNQPAASFPETHRRQIEDAWRELVGDTAQAVLILEGGATATGQLRATIWYERKDESSRTLSGRLRERLQSLAEIMTVERRVDLLGADPGAALALEVHDQATAEDKGAANLARFLPIMLVFLLLGGGSFAALSIFAGEREAGTLETLLVSPANKSAVVLGKFGAVLLTGLACLVSNILGLYLAAQLGWEGLSGGGSGGISLERLAGAFVFVPACILVCAILCLACGRARSFREGQHKLLPLMLALAVPNLVVLAPGLEHNYLLALVPLTGAALSLRDALLGELTLGVTLAMILSHLAWSAFAVRQLAGLLDAERVLIGAASAEEAGNRRLASRHAQAYGFGAVLLMLGLASRLQAQDMLNGLLTTLWGMMLPLALVCLWHANRRFGPARPLDFIRSRPRIIDLFLAILIAPGLAWVIEYLVRAQEFVLPLPEAVTQNPALAQFFQSTSLGTLLFAMAVSPGIVEELLFRGAILGTLARDKKPVRAVVISSLFFSAAHASLHRLMPTFLIGSLLGTITLRSGSLWPAVVLHVTYNSWVMLLGTERLPEVLVTGWGQHLVWLALPSLFLLLRPRKPRSAN